VVAASFAACHPIAVLCDRCAEEDKPLRFVCRGYPATDGRIPVEAKANARPARPWIGCLKL
jgi:hypothetical protein